MKNLETPAERIRYFAKAYYDGIGRLASYIGMPQSTFSQYTSKKNPQKPGHDFLVKLYKAGCSSNWILFGDGQVFADNEMGYKLRKVDIVDREKGEQFGNIKYTVLSEYDLKELIKQTVKETLKEYKK